MFSPIQNCIIKKDTTNVPIWIMRQAGRYLPEFREIRSENPDFIKLCLNKNLTPQITLQPLKRFDLDAAIIFSDILMLPYALDQKVEFKKGIGPILGDLEIEKLSGISEKEFFNKLKPVYDAINIVSKDKILKNKDMIGFVGAPWTILVYMIYKKSPKEVKNINDLIFNKIKKDKINVLMSIIVKFLKIHIKNQVDSGSTIIQIFDSWAGLLNDDFAMDNYIYKPTYELVDYAKKLGVPIICFPRGTKNYKKYCKIVKPDAISIDYEVDPEIIAKEIEVPVQGGLDPKILLTNKEKLKKETIKYLEIFKDHPYIFNLGHGVLPETSTEMVECLVKTVKRL